jgi:hypothetical protein
MSMPVETLDLQRSGRDGVSQELHEQIKRSRDKYHERPTLVKRFREYAKGKQAITLTDKQKEILAGLLENDFSDNVLYQVLAEARDRLRFIGFTSKNAGVQQELSNAYAKANLKRRQSEIHFDTLQDGNHVLALEYDLTEKRVIIIRQPWWDGTEGVFIAYGSEDKKLFGVKDWHTFEIDEHGRPSNVVRRNVWFDHELQKFISRNGGASWEKAFDPEDMGRWPIPWKKRNGEPLHIPYVHFRNSGKGTINYGLSELEGGLLGFQDQINDLQLALSGGGRMTAFQMYWIAGLDPSLTVSVGSGVVWILENPEAKAGVLQPGDMTQLLAIYDKKLQRIAQVSRTPLHAIKGGDWPSGEALLRAEQPAVGKAEVQIDSLQDAWTEVGHRWIEITNRFRPGSVLEEDFDTAPISARFDPPERRDLISKATIVNMIRDDISPEERLRILGKSEEEIAKIIKEKDAHSEKEAERMVTQFSRGTGPGTGLPGRGPQPDEEEE